jgi:hypothetical protein
MEYSRQRVPAGYLPRQSESIPESQARAVERRHHLDEQQRSFRKSGPAPGGSRPRPPA